jgi:hypothetical protein
LERLTDQLRGAPSVITVQSLWKEDTLAFVAAAIQDFKPPESVRPTVIVSSAEVWARVIEQPGRMTLIPLFGDPDIARALTQGHHIVLVSGRDEIAMGPVVNLPRPHRQVVSDALQAAGIDSGPAYRLAALARRSMPALIRSIARDPRFKIPPWARPPASDTLAPLVLVGSWTASEQDRALAKRMADAPWGKVEKALTEWTATDDPPFVRSATEWHLASAEEAFRLFARVFTHGDLARWHKIAAEVLLEPDPVGELPPDERPTAGLRGVARKYSEVLRAGVARGVAVIGSLEGEKLADDVSCADHARAIVRDVLAAANANPSGLSWRSLSDVLPRLAEAAPEVFLDALHEDLNREQPLLGSMFQDGGQGSWLYSASPHTGLLWALENLCWSPAYIADAARALARLCQIDPGGRLGNRPIASLQSVLVGWVRHNSASLPTRVKVLEAIVAQFPDVAWPLLLRLWPATHAVSSPPSEPHFRDWTPETRSVPIAEWIEYIGHVVRLALGLSVNNPLRCAELAEHLGPLPPSDLHRVLDFLDEAAKPSTLSHSDRLIMWERIHKEASRHRRFSQAKWSMGDEPLSRLERIASRLEPTDSVERFAYLFDWHPALGDVALDDHVSYDRQLESLRVAAIERTLSLGSPEALRSLARRSPVPSHFGMTLGRVSKDEHDAELLSWLDDDNEKIRESSAYWASQKLRDHGVTWLQRTLAAPSMTLARRATLVAGAPATAEMWQVIETDPELPKMYWQRMNPLGVDALGAEQASRQLIAHDRAWDAVDMLAMVLYRSRDTSTTTTSITPALVQEVLNSAHKSGSKTALSPSLGYDLGQLLDYLEDNNTPIEDLAKYEFQFFRLLQDWSHRRPSALFRAMAASPSLFVHLVTLAYRARSEPKHQLEERETALARHAWWVLNHWDAMPGQRDDGTIDGELLSRWVREARLALADEDRADIGDEEVGRVLAASPDGADGAWPAEPVRDLVDSIGSTHLETGLHVGRMNSRGVTTRGVYDGGEQERALSKNYRDWAQLTEPRWPRIGRVLRRLAEDYERQAHREDARAEVTADTE